MWKKFVKRKHVNSLVFAPFVFTSINFLLTMLIGTAGAQEFFAFGFGFGLIALPCLDMNSCCPTLERSLIRQGKAIKPNKS